RDYHVAGVQTCALPIYKAEAAVKFAAGHKERLLRIRPEKAGQGDGDKQQIPQLLLPFLGGIGLKQLLQLLQQLDADILLARPVKIGRASCMERTSIPAQ